MRDGDGDGECSCIAAYLGRSVAQASLLGPKLTSHLVPFYIYQMN